MPYALAVLLAADHATYHGGHRTAWGMHQIGDNDRTKTKLVEWDAFRESLLAQRETFTGMRHLRMLDLSEADYADALTELEPAYRKLKLRLRRDGRCQLEGDL